MCFKSSEPSEWVGKGVFTIWKDETRFRDVRIGDAGELVWDDMVIDGRLSPRVLGMVTEWAARHQEELMKLWERAQNHQPLYRLPPLE